jgi:putative ATP-binding cassette transporter
MKKYLFLLIILASVEISLALYLTVWRENFWNAVSQKQGQEFLYQLGIFTVAALCICFTSGISGYLLSLTVIEWRKKLNIKALDNRYMRINLCSNCAGSGHDETNPFSWMCYTCEGHGKILVENINQRIQADCMEYPDLFLSLIFGTLKAIMYVLVFSISLLMHFSVFYLCILTSYTFIGLLCTKYIAYPLIQLNYEQQKAEATYRQDLSINGFNSCVFLMLGLAKKQKHLTYFQQLYGQVSVILPLILIAPMYFTTSMTLGMLMRFNSLSSTLLENMSYGVNSFASINRWLSCRKRLKEIGVI